MSLYSREYFTFIGSIVYAMLLIVIGCVINAQDIFVEGHKRGSRGSQVMVENFAMYTISRLYNCENILKRMFVITIFLVL